MTMTGRFVKHGICLLAAVALLLAVMSSPIRPPVSSRVAPPPNYLPRNFAILKFGSDGQVAMPARPSLGEAGLVPSEIADEREADVEEELILTSSPASPSFALLPSPCPEPCSGLVRSAFALVARPLRC